MLCGVLILEFSLRTKVLEYTDDCPFHVVHTQGYAALVGQEPIPGDPLCALFFSISWGREQHHEPTASVTAAW